jgi:2-dehydro-3-deoxyphosphooctonate aldolase (KDO 8-P synthase)
MPILKDVSSVLPTITDIHAEDDIYDLGGAPECNPYNLAMIQIPAMLSRQTSLLDAAGRSGYPVLIKKGQWMDAKEFYAAARKVAGAGGIPILCERGNMSGGRYLYVDMELLSELISSPYPVVFDCTHSARSREHSINMAKAAVAMGVDGIFAEVHQKPEHAPSDGARMLNFDQARKLIEVCLEAR